ncbi:MAG: carbohydrate binding family 9 domain-containing protein [Planctomycetota bacterium]
MDGVLDESIWKQVVPLTGFIDERTKGPADQQTKVYLAYTQTHLYIAVECLEDRMDRLVASEQREDRFFRGDDFIEVQFDPLHSHSSRYSFLSNALGTRVDGKAGPVGRTNFGWSAEWQQSAAVHEDRWIVEMEIPFGILNYFQKDDQEWGLNIKRKHGADNVFSFWSYNPTDPHEAYNFGHLHNLNLSDTVFDRNREITPYTSFQADYNGDTDTSWQAGADVSFRLTPSVSTALTFNPDFGQIEADADTIELRDTERFLPEKRLFFREGEELFRMPYTLYYSRRFTDFEAGGRVTGDLPGGYSFSLVDIYGDAVHGETFNGNSTLGRLVHNVGEKSTINYYFSSSDFKTGHSRVFSVDGEHFLTDDWQVMYQTSYADENLEEYDSESKDSSDYLGYGALTYEVYPWRVRFDYRAITEDFNPVLGYIPRRDIFGPSFEARYHVNTDKTWYKEVKAKFETQFYQDGDGRTVLRDYDGEMKLTTLNDVEWELGYDNNFHDPYDNHRYSIGATLDSSDYYHSTELKYQFGEFEETDYDELMVAKNLLPHERWPITLEYTVRFEEDEFGDKETVWLNRVVSNYYFNKDTWLKMSLQHRNDDIRNISVILGTEFRPDTHLYLVYNNVKETDDPEAIQTLFVKLQHTFR